MHLRICISCFTLPVVVSVRERLLRHWISGFKSFGTWVFHGSTSRSENSLLSHNRFYKISSLNSVLSYFNPVLMSKLISFNISLS